LGRNVCQVGNKGAKAYDILLQKGAGVVSRAPEILGSRAKYDKDLLQNLGELTGVNKALKIIGAIVQKFSNEADIASLRKSGIIQEVKKAFPTINQYKNRITPS
jgi:hypothetical protein